MGECHMLSPSHAPTPLARPCHALMDTQPSPPSTTWARGRLKPKPKLIQPSSFPDTDTVFTDTDTVFPGPTEWHMLSPSHAPTPLARLCHALMDTQPSPPSTTWARGKPKPKPTPPTLPLPTWLDTVNHLPTSETL